LINNVSRETLYLDMSRIGMMFLVIGRGVTVYFFALKIVRNKGND